MRFLTCLVLVCSVSFAEESIFQDWEAGGNACQKENVQVLKSTDTLSILFNAFNIHLQGKEDHQLAAQRRCNFRIQVLPPAGYYLAGFTQLYSGGILKTAATEVRLDIAYKVASVMNSQTIEWKRGVKIRPEDAASSFSRTYTDVASKFGCREKFQYHIIMGLTVQRRGKAQGVSVGLDSVDAQAGSEVLLSPQWKPCLPKKKGANGA